MTGVLSPDLTGYFFENGTQGGSPAYERMDGGAWLWDDGLDYIMSIVKGDYGAAWWVNDAGAVVPGTYSPAGAATGIATVAAVIE